MAGEGGRGREGRPAALPAAPILAVLLACTPGPARAPGPVAAPPSAALLSPAAAEALLADLEERTFHFFWETTNPENGLVPDRYPTPSFSSIAAVGFGLTAYPIGVERGYITREQARRRVLATLRFFAAAPQGPEPEGVTGHRGFFYHFLDMETGTRFEDVELSTIDTSLLLAGALFCQSYFDADEAGEVEIRELAEALYRAPEWSYFLDPFAKGTPRVSMGWRPERGFVDYYWTGYNEAMILFVLALGSPTHPLGPEAWEAFTASYQWERFYGQEYLTFAPLFGHQYSHVWIDFRGIQDDFMRQKGIDYFENSRRAAYAQRAYATRNPLQWRGYGPDVWGLTASDGPADVTVTLDGRRRTFHTYWARGVAPGEIHDDGTIAPTAAASSLPFAPELALPAIAEMRRRYGEDLYSTYGFLDAFNPTFQLRGLEARTGRVVPGKGWFDSDYLGIDQGPIVAMIENHRSGLVWKVMRGNPHIVRGLRRAGFRGGWLEEGEPREREEARRLPPRPRAAATAPSPRLGSGRPLGTTGSHPPGRPAGA